MQSSESQIVTLAFHAPDESMCFTTTNANDMKIIREGIKEIQRKISQDTHVNKMSNEISSSSPQKKKPKKDLFEKLTLQRVPSHFVKDILGQLKDHFVDLVDEQMNKGYKAQKSKFILEIKRIKLSSTMAADDPNDKQVQQASTECQAKVDEMFKKASQHLHKKIEEIIRNHQKDISASSVFTPINNDVSNLLRITQQEVNQATEQELADFDEQINSVQDKCIKEIKEIAMTADNVVKTLQPDQILQDSIKSYGAFTAKPFMSQKRKILKPTKHKVILISNEKYENVQADFKPWLNLESSPQKTKVFRRFCTEHLQIDSNDIIQLDNPTLRMILTMVRKLKFNFQSVCKSKDARLCVWVYYTGHGVMNNQQYIVLNERRNKHRFYDLEYQIRSLTKHFKNTAAFMFFDTCRQTLSLEKMDIKRCNADQPQGPKQVDASIEQEASEIFHNVISVYACNESSGLKSDNFALDIVDVLTSEIQDYGGVLRFPLALRKICEVQKGANYRVQCAHEIWVDVSRDNVLFRPRDRKWIDSQPPADDSTTFWFPSPEQVAEFEPTELQQLSKISFDEETKNWQFETSAGCQSDFGIINSEINPFEIDQNQRRIEQVTLFSQNSCLSGMIIKFDGQDNDMHIGLTNTEQKSTIFLEQGEKITGVRGRIKNQVEKTLHEFQFIIRSENIFAKIKHQLVQKKKTLSTWFNETYLVKSNCFDLYHEGWKRTADFNKLQEVQNLDMPDQISKYSGFVNKDKQKEGWGRLTTYNGNLGETWYEGQFHKDKKCGFGKMIHSDGTQQIGNWKDDQLSGLGKEQQAIGTVYEGEYLKGKRHGLGTMKFDKGSIFCGEFQEDCMHGIGEQTDSDGQRLIGVWNRETETVEGMMIYRNGVSDIYHDRNSLQIFETK